MQITQDDARNFAMTLNNIGGYVPPMLMSQLIGTTVCQVVQAVANGQATLAVTQPQLNGSGGPQELPKVTETQLKEGKA